MVFISCSVTSHMRFYRLQQHRVQLFGTLCYLLSGERGFFIGSFLLIIQQVGDIHFLHFEPTHAGPADGSTIEESPASPSVFFKYCCYGECGVFIRNFSPELHLSGVYFCHKKSCCLSNNIWTAIFSFTATGSFSPALSLRTMLLMQKRIIRQWREEQRLLSGILSFCLHLHRFMAIWHYVDTGHRFANCSSYCHQIAVTGVDLA